MPNETTYGFFDDLERPDFTGYCSAVDCAPSTPCAECIALLPCDACGRPSEVLVDDGLPTKLPLCKGCDDADRDCQYCGGQGFIEDGGCGGGCEYCRPFPRCGACDGTGKTR